MATISTYKTVVALDHQCPRGTPRSRSRSSQEFCILKYLVLVLVLIVFGDGFSTHLYYLLQSKLLNDIVCRPHGINAIRPVETRVDSTGLVTPGILAGSACTTLGRVTKNGTLRRFNMRPESPLGHTAYLSFQQLPHKYG